jgi:hypothetical protein
MNHTRARLLSGLTTAVLCLASTASHAAAVAVRGGTFGYGADLDFGLTETINLRLGYNTFSLNRTVDDTDVTYDGKLKISSASAIFDWFAFHGGFHLSAGAVQQGPKIDITGVPSGSGTYELNGHTYTASEIGSIKGSIKVGDSAAPYVGIGWGNTVDAGNRFTFLFDIGAIHTGKVKTSLDVTCNASLPPMTCTQLQSDANAEKTDLDNKVTGYEWYPVVALGFAVRF